ncbi:hypothetical protein AgCh_021480 [Apium graveolens]
MEDCTETDIDIMLLRLAQKIFLNSFEKLMVMFDFLYPLVTFSTGAWYALISTGSTSVEGVCHMNGNLHKSPVQELQFALEGAKHAVRFEYGRVAVINMSSLSVSFLSDRLSEPSSSVIAIAWGALRQTVNHIGSPRISESKIPGNTAEQSLFALTEDARIYVINNGIGSMISLKPLHVDSAVISMYAIDGNITSSKKLTQIQEAVTDIAGEDEPSQDTSSGEIDHPKTDNRSQNSSTDPVLLLCCKDALLLYHMKVMVKGNNRPIKKMKLPNACCWTTTFKKFEKLYRIVLLYQTKIEVRVTRPP